MSLQFLRSLDPASSAPMLNAGLLLLAVACGFMIALAPVGPVLLALAAITGSVLLLCRPEVALALFLFAGMLKANPTLSGIASVDLTVGVGALLVLSCVYKLLARTTIPFWLPRAYLLYVPLIAIMLASLFYTPNFAAGVDKSTRFVFLTGLAIVAPFLLLDSPRKLRVFLYATATIGFLMSVDGLTKLGGSERLTAEGGLTIQLGTAAGVTISILWNMVLPQFSFGRRMLMLPLTAVPAIALIGSGARGAAIGAACCVLFGLAVHRKLLADAAVLVSAGAIGLRFIPIPEASYQYLSTLIAARSTAVLGLRNDLMALAWQLIRQHPLLGVGIGGYPYYSQDPQLFGWPHNIFLELGAELGIAAAVLFSILVMWSFREAIVQVRGRTFPSRELSIVVLSLLVFGFLQMIKSGDINDNRSMWLYLGLPFLLQFMADYQLGGRCVDERQQVADSRVCKNRPEVANWW